MSESVKKRRPWKRWVALALIIVLALPVVFLATLSSGALDDAIRRAIVDRIVQITGQPAELQSFHFDPWRLSLVLNGLTVHGREPVGTPPLFHVDRLEVGLRVDSWWGRKFSVGDVEVSRPQVHIRIERDGATNVPALPAPHDREAVARALCSKWLCGTCAWTMESCFTTTCACR